MFEARRAPSLDHVSWIRPTHPTTDTTSWPPTAPEERDQGGSRRERDGKTDEYKTISSSTSERIYEGFHENQSAI